MPYPGTPQFQAQLHDLVVNDHTQLEGEPLLLGIYYASELAPQDDCLFEVIANFGYDEVSDDGRIFQVQFGATANFPIEADGRLRLLLTNPVECEAAIQQEWREIRDLRRAIEAGDFMVMYRNNADIRAERLLTAIQRHRVAV